MSKQSKAPSQTENSSLKDFDQFQERLNEAACHEIDNFISAGNNFKRYNLYVTIKYCPENHKILTKFNFVSKRNFIINWWYSRKPNTLHL